MTDQTDRPDPDTLTLRGETFAVIPLREYEALTTPARAGREDIPDEDAADSAAIAAVLADPNEEFIPVEYVDRMIAGEHPVAVFRDLRGMTQTALAEASGVKQSYLSDIERGKTDGSVKALKAIAAALDVTVDDLI